VSKLAMLGLGIALSLSIVCNAFADIKYVGSYTRSNGTYVSGCFKDTSHDGNPYNNANYLGLND